MPDSTKPDCLIRLWVVVEEDRGMGAAALLCHASEEEANKQCSGHKFADPVDVPWSVLESLKPNATHQARAVASRHECGCSQEVRRG